MRELLVIGIGPGHPDQITVQAVQALNRVDVFFRIDKGEVKSGLNEVRDEILRRHVVQPDYRVVSIPEPERDRSPSLSSSGYQGSVRDWHEARAELLEEAIADSLPDPGSGVGAFLVWGDQSLYDSTLRIIEKILDRGVVSFACTVIPGVTSVQALAAAHRIPLNRVGEPVHITPARRIAGGLPAGIDNAVVMLDSGFTAAGFADPSLEVYWGAYLGTPDETLVAGRLADVADEITNTRAELRTRHGWIMDTYLLRREQGGAEKNGLPARAVERLRGRRGRPGRRADRSPVRRGVHQERCSCRSRSLTARGAQTLVLFITPGVTAVLLVAPQPVPALGAELLAVAAASGTVLLVLDRRAGHDQESRVVRYIERASPNLVTVVLILMSGLTLLLAAGGGLYWLIPAALAGLVGGVINAWLFLLKVPA